MELTNKLTAIADAIRAKTGGTDLLSLDGMAEAIEGIQAGGGDPQLDAFIEGTVTELTTNVSKIGENAFLNRYKITNVNMPNVTSIDSYAFRGCTKLELTSLPKGLTSIGSYAFDGCTKLALTSLPSGVTNIGAQAFNNCANLALTSLPSGLTKIDSKAFFLCNKLAVTSIPSGVTTVGSSAFSYCSGLTSITFEGTPTKIDSTAFNSSSNLTTINVPWAEGSGPSGAPWGAVNATINYNYTGE